MQIKPSRDAILEQLERILASPEFAAAPRMTVLLRHLVACTIDGRTAQLTGYAIGLDVFERSASFDPAQDSIVRVQMTRLRRMLEEFYAVAGVADDVIIAIPKGQYCAQFSYAPSAAPHKGPEPEAAAPIPRARGRVWQNAHDSALALSLTVIALVAVVSFALASLVNPRTAQPAPGAEPRVLVTKYTARDDVPETRLIAQGIQRDLIAELAQYANFEVIGYDTASQTANGKQAAAAHDADYTLSGDIDFVKGAVKVYSRLTEIRSGVVIWTDVATLDVDDTVDLFAAHRGIAFEVASTLGQSYGVIQNAGRRLESAPGHTSFEGYACVLATYDYMREKSAAAHRDVRGCLEKTTRTSPNYASAWALLSWVYGDEARYSFNPRRGDDATLRALKAAKRAVGADTRNAMAHQYLAVAQYYLNRDAEALNSARIALSLSPNSSEVLANVGWIQAFVGDPQDGEALMQRALDLNPLHPSWYWWGMAINAIKQRRAEDALRMSMLYTDDRPMSDYVRIAAERLNGRGEIADSMLRDLGKSTPDLIRPDNDFLKRNRVPDEVTALVFSRHGDARDVTTIPRSQQAQVAEPR